VFLAGASVSLMTITFPFLTVQPLAYNNPKGILTLLLAVTTISMLLLHVCLLLSRFVPCKTFAAVKHWYSKLNIRRRELYNDSDTLSFTVGRNCSTAVALAAALFRSPKVLMMCGKK